MSATTPGSFVWYDLFTTDPKAAITFYEKVLGWKSAPMEHNATTRCSRTQRAP